MRGLAGLSRDDLREANIVYLPDHAIYGILIFTQRQTEAHTLSEITIHHI